MPKPKDDLFYKALKQKDENAWCELYRRTNKYLRNIIIYFLSDDTTRYSQIEDFISETYKRAYMYIKTFQELSAIETWLYKIAKNVVDEDFKKSKHHKHVCISDEDRGIELILSGKNTDPLEQCLTKEIWEIIGDSNKFSVEYAKLIVGHYKYGLTEEELARTFNMPLGTVKGNLSRARKELQNTLKYLINIANSIDSDDATSLLN